MIVVQPGGGLANRLACIVSAYELAKGLQEELKIVWIKNYCFENCDFSDLFEPLDGIEIINYDQNIKLIDQMKRSSNIILTMTRDFRSLDTEDFERFRRFRDLNIYIIGCLNFKTKGSFSIFKPKPFIMQKVEQIINTDEIIGINIRETGYPESIYPGQTNLIEFRKLIINLIRETPKIKIFLTCDVNNTSLRLKEEFENNIIISNRIHKFGTKDSMIEATIDFYCLAKCKIIYGSKYTAFSQLAAKINNNKHIMVINE